MISITGKKWKETKINKNSIEKLKQEHNFSEILSKLIVFIILYTIIKNFIHN